MIDKVVIRGVFATFGIREIDFGPEIDGGVLVQVRDADKARSIDGVMRKPQVAVVGSDAAHAAKTVLSMIWQHDNPDKSWRDGPSFEPECAGAAK